MMVRQVLGALACAFVVAGCSSSGNEGSAAATTAPPTRVTTALLEVSSSTWNAGTITLADGAPTQDWGVVAAPRDGGPFPVVVLLHGNHPTCPTDTGGGTWPCPSGTEEPNLADERLTSPLRLRLSAPGGPSTEVELPLPEVRRTLIDPFTVTFGLAMWSTVTLPLPDGASALRVDVLGPSAGSMQILSLGVAGPP